MLFSSATKSVSLSGLGNHCAKISPKPYPTAKQHIAWGEPMGKRVVLPLRPAAYREYHGVSQQPAVQLNQAFMSTTESDHHKRFDEGSLLWESILSSRRVISIGPDFCSINSAESLRMFSILRASQAFAAMHSQIRPKALSLFELSR